MNLKQYFSRERGTGVLDTADLEGKLMPPFIFARIFLMTAPSRL